MRKIVFIIGTRAEAIKILPLTKELEKKKHDYSVLSTGQHDLSEFKFKDFLELNKAKGKSGAFKGVIQAVFFLLKSIPLMVEYLKEKDCFVIVHGDTMTTTAGAIAGRLASRQVCHLESGLRTGDFFQPFPEEASRVITDALASIHFAPTERAFLQTNPHSTFLVGNTVIDAIKEKKLKVTDKKFVLVSVHRQENVNNKAVMERIVSEILRIASKRKVVWLMHGNTIRKLDEYGLMKSIKAACDVRDLMPYEKFLPLLATATGVLSDSGGLAEECAYLKKPLVILREKTERMESVEHGYALLGFDFDFEYFLKNYKQDKEHIYGEGNSSEKIVHILERLK
ncbi:UDP-N-acetylglucosamine 2-epimerase [Candidatus Micrarchaeota archaeon]|nr:UDP-N-acetylglucosamine 2-epimerase [Candidatus Micrarchaeota archaeon]